MIDDFGARLIVTGRQPEPIRETLQPGQLKPYREHLYQLDTIATDARGLSRNADSAGIGNDAPSPDSVDVGAVELQVLVGVGGTVDSVVVLDGPAIFIDAAIDAAKRTRFSPAKFYGEPVESWVLMPFRFMLDE